MAPINKGLRVEGLEKTIASLNALIYRKVPGASMRGLIKAGFLLQREAARLTPVDTGNLRASSFVVWRKQRQGLQGAHQGAKAIQSFKGKDAALLGAQHQSAIAGGRGRLPSREPAVMVGYSAFYAPFVHERVELAHTVGQAKFLETAAKRFALRMVAVVKLTLKEEL